MALRNAFDLLAQEGTLRRLLQAATLPRDSSDRVRVAVEAGSSITVAQYWGATNVYPSWYSTGAGNSMDERESQVTQSQVMIIETIKRWTIT